MPMYKIAVLASTNGTDLQAIIDEMKAGKMPNIDLSLVVSNKKNCFALERAKQQGFPTMFIDPKQFESPEAFDEKLTEILLENKIDLIVLVGYMRILTPSFVRKFRNKIINIHPSLLPKFSGPGFYGKNVHEAVLKAGERETGCTIHFVDEGVDTGKIILQKSLLVEPQDTSETLKERVQGLEKKWYPEIIRKFSQGEIR